MYKRQPINQTVTSNGITVTAEKVVCDGSNLYVSYIIKKDTKFDEYQLSTNIIISDRNTVDFKKNSNLWSKGSLEGAFVDDYTFVGIPVSYTHLDVYKRQVQTLHIICGEEFNKLKEQVESYKDKFEKIILGRPLLTYIEDYKETVEAIENQIPKMNEQEAVVFMGHGTFHESHST